jgi:hypothetical protein
MNTREVDEWNMQEARIDVAHFTTPTALVEQSVELLEVAGRSSLEQDMLTTAPLPELLENRLMVIKIFEMHLEEVNALDGRGGSFRAQGLPQTNKVNKAANALIKGVEG